MPIDSPANPVTVVIVVPEMPNLLIDSIVASINCLRRTSFEAVRPAFLLVFAAFAVTSVIYILSCLLMLLAPI